MTAIPADTERERDLPDDQPWKRALRRLVHRRGAMIGAAVVLFFVLMAIFAPMIAPYAPIATDWAWSSARWYAGIRDEVVRLDR